MPEDSERLPDALFEASWSMFQKGEYEAAGAFIDQFDRMFPKSPLAPDVLLLHAMIDLKSCAFDQVRTTLDTLVKTYAPIEAEVAALIKDPARRRALYRRLLSKDRIGDPRDRIVELLKIDSRFYRYYSYIVALDREAGLLPGDVATWDELTAKQTGKARRAQDDHRGGAAGRGRSASWRRWPRATPRWKSGSARCCTRRARPRARSARGAGRSPPRHAETLALGGEAQRLRARLVAATTAIAEAALIDLDNRLRHLLRQARLTHIDAVIGKKKKLEIEIANLREGRYPPDMFATAPAGRPDGRRRGVLALRGRVLVG